MSALLNALFQITKGAIQKYDEGNGLERTRGDFLAMFRQEQKRNADRMSDRDLMNHLVNNLSEISHAWQLAHLLTIS
jgi:hypothetical protein